MVETQPTYDLTLEAEKVPLTSMVRLLRQAKKQIPGDLTASGLLNAEFHATRSIPDRGSGGRLACSAGRGRRLSRARQILAALIADLER